MVYQRSEHHISRSQLSANALKVLYRLKESDFQAYLVGGCVRDLLLGREPKDFDVVTDAHPEQIKKVFRNCRLIGRRFRLAHVYFGREIIEVATFRGSSENNNESRAHENGRLLRDNVYGTLEEDVWRRDFTVNALYYNIADFSVVDFVGGMDDHQRGMLKLIGDAEVRYQEDPVRMLRTVRFAVKLSFNLHPDSEHAMIKLAYLLNAIPAARLNDEMLKLFLSGYAIQTFEMLRHFNLFAVLFPETDNNLASEEQGFPKLFLAKALANTDARLATGKTVTPYFLMAVFLWDPVQSLAHKKIAQGINAVIAFQEAGNEVISRQVKCTAFPKRVGLSMREVWDLQLRLERTKGAKVQRLLEHPRFRAAYDFLLLRAKTGGAEPELAQWWTDFHQADNKTQVKMTQNVRKPKPRKR